MGRTRRFRSRLRELRARAGLQQRELAARVGVSRQALSAVEAGDAVPATSVALELAHILGCRVEDIFWLADDSPTIDALWLGPVEAEGSKRSGAKRLALAAIDDRWIAHALDGDSTVFAVPADGLLADRNTGALNRRSARVRPLRQQEALRENVLIAGCDPALALLAAHAGEHFRQGRLHWIEAGSSAALDMLSRREVHAAGLHLFDEATGEYNVATVRRTFLDQAVVLVNLAVWEQGIAVAPGNPKAIRGVPDLARKGVRVVGREAGTGADEVLGRLAAKERVPRKNFAVVAIARSHTAVAQAVAVGGADAGITTRAAAATHGVDFLPLVEARFDLALPSAAARQPRIRRLLDLLTSSRFRRDLGSIAGYGTTRTGDVVAEVTQ
jgi:molybdate-binding protein/DNA-binding XRE family transcriptional regulator